MGSAGDGDWLICQPALSGGERFLSLASALAARTGKASSRCGGRFAGLKALDFLASYEVEPLEEKVHTEIRDLFHRTCNEKGITLPAFTETANA